MSVNLSIKSPVNKILVDVGQTYEDKIGSIFIDPTYKPEDHVKIYGTVVSPPMKVSKDYKANGIFPVVEAGDKLYFNYLTCLDKTNRLDIIDNDGNPRTVWMVDYNEAICFVRDGRITTIGVWVLMEPTFHVKHITDGGIHIPEAYQKKEDLTAIYRYGNEPDLVGETLYFDPIGKFLNNIEGKDYYCMYDYNLHGVKN